MKKSDLKLFGIIVGGVIAAGFVMSQLNDNTFIAKAQNGFQGVI